MSPRVTRWKPQKRTSRVTVREQVRKPVKRSIARPNIISERSLDGKAETTGLPVERRQSDEQDAEGETT